MAINLYYTVIFCTYYAFLCFVFWGWKRTPLFRLNFKKNEIAISVIVAARNEEKKIMDLLESLKKQSYQNFEIIVIDDHSEDGTLKLMQDFQRQNPALNLKVLSQTQGKEGKKAAILLGLKHAQSNYILTTDADCTMGVHWVNAFAEKFLVHDAYFITGPVAFEPKASFLQTELSSLIATTAATIYFRTPSMANGANMGYRKDIFAKIEAERLYTQSSSPSGDDEFLLQRMGEFFPEKIFFLKSKEAIVTTQSPSSLSEFIQQRLRWASKWQMYEGIKPKILALLIFILNFSQFISVLLVALGYVSWQLFLALLCIKVMFEFILLSDVLNFHFRGESKKWIFIWSLIYPFYAVAIGLSSLRKTFYWKDRKYSS